PSSSRSSRDPPDLPSFPTRRSSDLGRSDHSQTLSEQTLSNEHGAPPLAGNADKVGYPLAHSLKPDRPEGSPGKRTARPSKGGAPDRKSTRLNSSHDQISYAVFCLKK